METKVLLPTPWQLPGGEIIWPINTSQFGRCPCKLECLVAHVFTYVCVYVFYIYIYVYTVDIYIYVFYVFIHIYHTYIYMCIYILFVCVIAKEVALRHSTLDTLDLTPPAQPITILGNRQEMTGIHSLVASTYLNDMSHLKVKQFK